MKKILSLTFLALFYVFALVVLKACRQDARSTSGVAKATVKVPTDLNGNTAEQLNIMERLIRDNQPGSIKHLYIISPYSGQVIMYSTVRNKVTSSGKRLSPKFAKNGEFGDFAIEAGGINTRTDEILGDDGTYGESGDYIFWFDSKGAYHQHYLSGGQIIHVSDQPLSVSSIIINVEQVNAGGKKQ